MEIPHTALAAEADEVHVLRAVKYRLNFNSVLKLCAHKARYLSDLLNLEPKWCGGEGKLPAYVYF